MVEYLWPQTESITGWIVEQKTILAIERESC